MAVFSLQNKNTLVGVLLGGAPTVVAVDAPPVERLVSLAGLGPILPRSCAG